MMSPSDPNRTSRNLASGIGWPTKACEQVARGMVLRIADNRDTDAKHIGYVPLGHARSGIVGPFSMDVRLELAQQGTYVRLIEDHDVIHDCQRGHQSCTGALGKDRSSVTLQPF